MLNIALLLRIRGRFPDMIIYFVTCWWEKNVRNKREVCVSVGRHFNNKYPGEQVFGWDVVCKHTTGARVCYFLENRINLLSFRQQQRFNLRLP
jgi:hypothetical protein